MPIGGGATLNAASDDSSAGVRLGTECIEVFQKANKNDYLPEPLGPHTEQLKVWLNMRLSPMEGRAVTRPFPRYILL